jgi:quinol monooxygenase YgiN
MFRFFLLAAVVVAPEFHAQQPADATAYTVSYIEVTPASRATTLSALKQYRDSSRKDSGFVRMEFFEQLDRPAHFVVIEAWADAKASDAHTAAAHTKDLLNKLKPVRLSDYDQRPYKTLSVVSSPTASNTNSVYVISHVDIGGAAGEVPGQLQRLADASRKEEGNLRFDVLLHTMRANHFTVIEAWKDRKALDAHAAAPHTRAYRETLQPMLGSPLDERLFKAVE